MFWYCFSSLAHYSAMELCSFLNYLSQAGQLYFDSIYMYIYIFPSVLTCRTLPRWPRMFTMRTTDQRGWQGEFQLPSAPAPPTLWLPTIMHNQMEMLSHPVNSCKYCYDFLAYIQSVIHWSKFYSKLVMHIPHLCNGVLCLYIVCTVVFPLFKLTF